MGLGHERAPVAPQEVIQGPPDAASEAETVRTILLRRLGKLGVDDAFAAWLLHQNIDLESVYREIRASSVDDVAIRLGFRQPPVAQHAAAAPGQAAAARQEAAPARRQPRATARAARTAPVTGGYWRDELIADIGLYLLSLAIWLLNGLFTVVGVVTVVPKGPIWLALGVILGVGLHLLISRIEIAFLNWRRVMSFYLVVIVGAVTVDVGTTHQGLLTLVGTFFPSLLGGAPMSTLEHLNLVRVVYLHLTTNPNNLAGVAQLPAIPGWWFMSLVFLGLSALMALGSERLMRRFYRGMQETWQLRGSTNH